MRRLLCGNSGFSNPEKGLATTSMAGFLARIRRLREALRAIEEK
jgi:hypothetical protein